MAVDDNNGETVLEDDMDWKSILADLKAAGRTQKDIATKCGCAQTTISDLATGKTDQPAYSIGERLMALHKSATRRRKAEAA